MNRPKHNRWLLTLFLVCAIILSLPLPKANAQNFVNNRFNVVVVLDASGSMKNTDPNGLRYDCLLYTSPSPRDRQKSRMPSSA